MRNRVASNTTESYRIVTGSNADKVIGRTDARLYHRGHAFGRGFEALVPDGRQRPQTPDYSVIFGAAATKKSGDLGLPFFSKVSLRPIAARIQFQMGSRTRYT
jgi:hypothetical protein